MISYMGGKYRLIDHIVPIIEYAAQAYGLHRYYEVCGGGARMLLNMRPTVFPHRSYNELDIGLCNLFACLGDRECLYDLQALLEQWPCTLETFKQAHIFRAWEQRRLARGHTDSEVSLIHSAASMFVIAMMSRAADCVTFDPEYVRGSRRVQSYRRRVRDLPLFYPTLADVKVTHGDAFEVLEYLDSDGLAYIDPPYTPEQMVLSDHYGSRSWTMDDHERLVDDLLSVPGKVVLSGYDNRCYRRLEDHGWRKVYLKNLYVPPSAKSWRRVDEYVWLNFELPSALLDKVSAFDYGLG